MWAPLAGVRVLELAPFLPGPFAGAQLLTLGADTDLVRDREQWYAARPEYMQRMVERATRYLDLDAAQQQRLGTLVDQMQASRKAVRGSRCAARWVTRAGVGEFNGAGRRGRGRGRRRSCRR